MIGGNHRCGAWVATRLVITWPSTPRSTRSHAQERWWTPSTAVTCMTPASTSASRRSSGVAYGAAPATGSDLPLHQGELGGVAGDAVVVDHDRRAVGVAQDAAQGVLGVLPVALDAADEQRLVDHVDHLGGRRDLERVDRDHEVDGARLVRVVEDRQVAGHQRVDAGRELLA